jgi:hypothetical protein
MKADKAVSEPTTEAERLAVDARADALDVLEAAWGIIANAGGGDWTKETQMWQDAAARWRDRYHAILAERQS